MAGEIYFNNLTGKFDWGSIVDQILKIKATPIQRLSQEANQVQSKQNALQSLIDALGNLSKTFENLSVNDLFKGKRATSSDSSVLNAKATEDAPNVMLNLSVNQLAQREVLVTTEGISDINQNISWSAFQIAYNTGGSTLYFDVPSGAGKLSDLINAINSSAGSKVVANIFYDGSFYKLMLSEKDEGSSTAETTQGSTVIYFSTPLTVNGSTWSLDASNPLQEAKNARISIGSSNLTSPTNKFENFVSGISVEVKSTGNATITVSEDYSRVNGFFSDFVNAYNKVIAQIGKITAKNAIFQGDYSINGIKTELSGMLEKLFANDLVNLKEDGTLEVNSSGIDSLLRAGQEKLREVISDLKEGMGVYSSRVLTTLQSFANDYQSRLDQINQRIESLGSQLIKEEERLRFEYAKVEAFINRAQEIMARMQAFIVSLSEMQGGKR
ncbi:MAG: flagellar filament capping protein FliD [Aquificaceae bacterium]|nr:flagellar filament capping protein FliD [Aquificaceae bacterium]